MPSAFQHTISSAWPYHPTC